MPTFDADRFDIARARRRVSSKSLAEMVGMDPATISRITTRTWVPDKETVALLAKALDYPVEFFFGETMEDVGLDEVSFRSLSRMRASERDAAIAAGRLGLLLSDWIESNFKLPVPNVPDMREADPEQAATVLRQLWALGEAPISKPIKLLESKGVRVFSLAENTLNVDAFSLWKSDTPFIFLNTVKTAERTAFDCAHELGHLVLHRHQRLSQSKESEREADAFASAFLMPKRGFLASMPRTVLVDHVLRRKQRWGVSAMAFVYRANQLERLSAWQYRSLCIELGKRGYRSGEPAGLPREASTILAKVFQTLWKEGKGKNRVASDLAIPLDELEGLVFGLAQANAEGRRTLPAESPSGPRLRRV